MPSERAIVYYTLEVYKILYVLQISIHIIYIALARDSLCLCKLIHSEGGNMMTYIITYNYVYDAYVILEIRLEIQNLSRGVGLE